MATKNDANPEDVAFVLAKLKQQRAQLNHLINRLEKMRQKGYWTDQEWNDVYVIHRQSDAVRKGIDDSRRLLKRMGADI